MEDDDDDDDDDRADTLNLMMKFLLKLIKDVFIFSDNEYVRNFRSSTTFALSSLRRIGRHFLQSQASIEVLRMLETAEVFHSFAPTDYVELFAAATVRPLTRRKVRWYPPPLI